MSDKFYTLWCPTFPTPPKKTYDTSEQAHAVAKSMATKQPGDEFHVMECIATYKAEKPVEPKLVVEQRKETKKEREAREANLEKERQALKALAAAPSYIPNMALNLVAKPAYPAPQSSVGRTGPLAPGEEPLAKARALIGKRVRIRDLKGLCPYLMDGAFRNQVDIELVLNSTPRQWGASNYPEVGDLGTVASAGDRRPQSSFSYYSMTPQPPKYTAPSDIALVIRLDRGITACVTMDCVEEDSTPPQLPRKMADLVEGRRYLLDDGTTVTAYKGVNAYAGRPEVANHTSILVSMESQLAVRRNKAYANRDNVGSTPHGWYLVLGA